MNESGRLEGMVGPFVAQMPGGKGAEFIVDQGHELGRRGGAVAVL
ncbi:MAG TPA: hypothetical protein VHX86_11785 [Tepidisphaeraceae bacterium]|nr:hypothetical protein [Tepidisphaeraceae bacterium]